jgi:hypothetical protein
MTQWEDVRPEGRAVERQPTGAGPLTWLLRVVLALAALAAPIITFKAFTDSDAPDPVREQRLREADDANRRPRPGATTADPGRDVAP